MDARRRLQAIENFSDLGSGIHIAMQDLDIRGAGNLLGAEQSGFIADLGYETYQKILSQAVTELRNEEFHDLYAEEEREGQVESTSVVDDCQLDSNLPMYFSEEYVPTSSERMLLYRELDGLLVVPLRRLGKHFGMERIVLKSSHARFFFGPDADNPFYNGRIFGQVVEFAKANSHRSHFKMEKGKMSLLVDEIATIAEAVALLKRL